MGAAKPKGPRFSLRGLRPEHGVLAALAVVLWWAVDWRVATTYGVAGGIIAATCAAWGFVLVSAWAAYALDRRTSPNRPGGPRPPTSGRWPGAAP